MTYLDDLKTAEALCSERSKKHAQETQRWEAEADRASCLTSALEALECARAIERLIEAQNVDDPGEASDG